MTELGTIFLQALIYQYSQYTATHKLNRNELTHLPDKLLHGLSNIFFGERELGRYPLCVLGQRHVGVGCGLEGTGEFYDLFCFGTNWLGLDKKGVT